MVCIVCFDVLVIITLLKHDRYSVRSLNCLTTCWLFSLAEIINMAVLMAEDKSRYNDMNTILCETDASKP